MTELTAGLYDTTDAFRAIAVHTAVMKADTMELVAITGTADDPLSEATARLFSAAPELLAAAQHALDELKKIRADHWEVADELRAAITKATGIRPPDPIDLTGIVPARKRRSR